jgi:hypothetical protein
MIVLNSILIPEIKTLKIKNSNQHYQHYKINIKIPHINYKLFAININN